MDVSPYANVGPKLIDRGLCAVPAVPGTKVPGILVAGRWVRMMDWARRYADRLPSDREVEGWSSGPDRPGVCLIMGRASCGIVAIDIDVEEAVQPVTAALPYTPARKRGAKGETLFFRGDVPSRSFNRHLPDGRRERLVDVLGEGRQTVLPPSIHPDTVRPYAWIGEQALEDLDPSELPELPADAMERIGEAMESIGYRPDAERKPIAVKVSTDGEKTPFRLLNEHALANLDAWVPKLNLCRVRKSPKGFDAVADWRSSNTGRPLNKRKLNLSITPGGIVDFGDGPRKYTAIDLVIEAKTADPDKAFTWLADVTGWSAPLFHDPKPRTKPQPEPEVNQPRSTGDKREAAPWHPSVTDTKLCPGLVGKIADWIVETSDFQQPLLAIGAALVTIGAVAGRHLAGPSRSGTHLYIIGVAPTGAGKDRPMSAINELLLAAKLSHLIGPGRFTSESAIINTVARSPSCVCAIDEFGSFLAKGRSRNASTHEQGISALLRTLYTSSFKPVATQERAGEQFKMLHSPSMSIFGTSTLEELYSALGSAETTNGLLNRFMILENPVRPQRIKAANDSPDPPQEIIDGLRAIYWRLGDLGSGPYHGAGDIPCPPPQIVPWRDELAELAYDELHQAIRERMDKEPENEKFFVRTAEMAIRMATIRAIGIDPRDPRVTVDDMNWGIAMAMNSAHAMIEGAKDQIAENYWEQSINKVVGAAKRLKTFKIRDIQQSTKMRGKELKEIISDLVEIGRIQMKDVTDGRSDSKRVLAYEFLK